MGVVVDRLVVVKVSVVPDVSARALACWCVGVLVCW